MVLLEWDEDKRASNKRRHGIDFADLDEFFDIETATEVDDRFDYGEIRFLTLGMLLGEVVAVTHTETEAGKDTVIRVISARKAERHEQETYYKNIRD